MTKSLEIRDLPDRIYERLALRADREGRSLSQQAVVELQRGLSKEGGGERRRKTLDRIRQDLDAGEGRNLSPTPEEIVRENRGRTSTKVDKAAAREIAALFRRRTVGRKMGDSTDIIREFRDS